MKRQFAFLLGFMLVSASLGFLIGAFVSDNHNTSMEELAQSQLAGLQEGFDKGFISGQDYQKGVYANLTNQTPKNKNWYFWAGYYGNTSNDKSMSIDRTTQINPYYIYSEKLYSANLTMAEIIHDIYNNGS